MASMLDGDRPDRKYWTDYDHFMAEREARALRRAHAYRLMRAHWHALMSALSGGIVSAASTVSRPVRPRA